MIVLAVYLTLTVSDPKISGYNCDDARRLVAEVGKVKALALAIESGLSLRQIWQIRRSCKL